ncbi:MULTISPECIES: MarR family winged helix-turn-helix transcriptional regulator [Brevibacillus]|jgi:DNA-binding MarR family transcriptional regulator|uniref:MarR family transcriptional regulator n=1 Tax=Brevibacillus aydinogluensis TaxID=927786 RepID=A0AA48RHS9_9BACL|nr:MULTISPECIES: MarR family winged helix-turn-helix transcriptional regulator [Brevibacillus]REK62436.1 MAG: MarR family transcriptional regulator [Brevibacillus sp.]MBR8659121.1 winged helix-turn-helix transcriptional regulator [Brevibacillus sp. NL20B1]MDT3418017.1 DNA-binding MarR family transcriptional regulator [Brevibacillus aydinogluensis]NNV02835.1 MarR family transcriptional regulator [Brevibacillus sp. MCWH]CAJ1003077.1 MarR family transcriptional regulator [Brevibacillus aydinoglue
MDNIREILQTMTRRIGLLNKNCCSVDGIDISVVQSHIIYEINRNHQPSMQQIAEILGMDVTTFSRQVQALVEAELVKKTPYAEDRRVHILSLTEKGKRIHDYIDRLMCSYYEDIFSHMSQFEKETVIRSLQLLNQAMARTKQCCNPMGD